MDSATSVPELAPRIGGIPRRRRGLRTLWLVLIVIVAVSFAALLYFGREIYQVAPPIPDAVVISEGQQLFSGDDVRWGQDVWRSIGGQELGSVWGHGAYNAPDWTADWLHREATTLVDGWSQDMASPTIHSAPSSRLPFRQGCSPRCEETPMTQRRAW